MIAEKRYYDTIDTFPIEMMPNMVLIKLDHYHKEEKTKGGVIMTSSLDDTELDDLDKYDQVDRTGIVVLLSKDIVFNVYDDTGLDWHPAMDIEIGDTVWLDQIDANTSERFIYNNERYKIIRYDAIIVAKRGENVICCNGNVLLSPVELEKSKLIQCVDKEKIINMGIVKYAGSKNLDYKSNYVFTSIKTFIRKPYDIQHDDLNIQIGDKVVFSYPEIWLESELFEHFGERLKYLQRRHILGTIN